jgi:hypothetical protein
MSFILMLFLFAYVAGAARIASGSANSVYMSSKLAENFGMVSSSIYTFYTFTKRM